MKRRTVIRSLAQLHSLIEKRRAVASDYFGMLRKPLPAAVVINLSGAILHRLIESGQMYVYERKSK